MALCQKLILGWTKIAGANSVAGLLRLLAFAIMAAALDVTAVGVIALIEAYARTIDGLFNFQSVNVLTKFLTEARHRNERQRFISLVKAGLIIDGATAFAAAAIAVAALPLFGSFFGITDEWTVPAMIFCLIIGSRVLGTAEAVLRCFERFGVIGLREVVSGAILVVCALVAWWVGGSPITFLFITLFAEFVSNILFLAWSFQSMRAFDYQGVWSSDARNAIRSAPGFWRLLWHTNLTFGVRMLSLQADVLVAGAAIGPQAAALLRAAKNIAALLSQFGRPLQQVASAPIARLWADGKGEELLVYTRRICMAAIAAGLLLTVISAVCGANVLRFMFGPEFVGASMTFTLMVLANTVYLSGVTLLPTMITLNASAEFFRAILWGTLAYGVMLAVLVSSLEIVGIAIAHIALAITWATYGWRVVLQRLNMDSSGGYRESGSVLCAKEP